jgi:hypothetical protein
MALLKELDLLKSSVLVSRLGHPEEKIITDLASLEGDKRAGYLSVVIVKVPPHSIPFPRGERGRVKGKGRA